jgi:hypothetical protein
MRNLCPTCGKKLKEFQSFDTEPVCKCNLHRYRQEAEKIITRLKELLNKLEAKDK